MMLACISEGNLRGENSFYRSHFDWCIPLKTSFSTVQRSQRALIDLGWIDVTSGYRNKRGHGVASIYEIVLDCKPPGEHWTQMPRYMFDTVLYGFGVDGVLAYVYLTSEFHRY